MNDNLKFKVTSSSETIDTKLLYKLEHENETNNLFLRGFYFESEKVHRRTKVDLHNPIEEEVQLFIKNSLQIKHIASLKLVGNAYEVEITLVGFEQKCEKIIFDLSKNPGITKEFIRSAVVWHDLNKKQVLLLGKDDSPKNPYFVISKDRSKLYEIEVVSKNEKYFFHITNELMTSNSKNKKRLEKSALIIFCGEFEFSEEESKSSNSQNAYDAFNLTNLNTMKYIQFWNKYNELESELKFSLIQDVKYLIFNKFEVLKTSNYKKTTVTLNLMIDNDSNEKIKKLKEDSMCFLSKDNLFSQFESNEKTIFKNVKNYIDFETKLNFQSIEYDITRGIIRKADQARSFLQIELVDSNINDFKPDNLPNKGFVMLSSFGDNTAYERRKVAKLRFEQNKIGMPILSSIFTDDPIPQVRVKTIPIDHTIFTKPMTPNQIEAINIICNTPDFAIIQGPPGTGKTTVITAAMNQINSKSQMKNYGKNTILSANRNETVENLIEKVNIFGLPTIKVENAKDNSKKRNSELVNAYFEEFKQKLMEKYKEIKYIDENLQSFINKKNDYIYFSNSIQETYEIIEYIKKIPEITLDPSIQLELSAISKKVSIENIKTDYQTQQFVTLLGRTPMNELNFEDGGAMWLTDLNLLLLNPSINKIKSNVEKFLDLFKYNPIDFKKVNFAKKKLLVLYKSTLPIFVSKALKNDLVNILYKIQRIIETSVFDKFYHKTKVIYNFVQSMSENPELLKETISKYIKVVGVTNQLVFSKGFSNSMRLNDVESVIVDEAATSSPLDLFIPMSVATRRIVLVGDHKQLPNIVDEKIAKLIEEGSLDNDKNFYNEEINQTIFQHLYKKCQLLEKKDGIRRVITLSSQYRMHPLLGKLVSDYFYEGFLESPRPESDFKHNFLGLKDIPLSWYNTKFNQKETYRSGNSRINKEEAKSIANKIKIAVEAKDFGNESIGVITFYRAQVAILKEALNDVGIKFNEDNNQMATLNGVSFSLEVNTVDAFQGKEFDIVFLSITYTFPIVKLKQEKFSRLVIKNLLCVALSRQKKMLIMVGSKEIFDNEFARDKVPSIHEFLKICKEKNFVYES